MILLSFFLLGSLVLYSKCVKRKTVVFVHSYRPGFVYSDDEDEGAVQGLAEVGWFESRTVDIHRKYMYTKTKNLTPDEMQAVADQVESEIETLHLSTGVDAIVTFDDDAMRYIGCKKRTIPLIFCGVNGEPSYYNKTYYNFLDSVDRPGHGISGIHEKSWLYESLRLVTYIFPGVENSFVRCFMENTTAGNLIGDSIKDMAPRILLEQNITVEVITVNTFQEYEKMIVDVNKNTSVKAIFLILHSLTDENNPSRKITSAYTIPWTGRNTKLPDLASSAPNSKMGLLGGVGSFVTGMGQQSGRYAGRVLSGEKAGDLPILTSPPMVFFNLDRLKVLGVTLPDDLLSYAAEVFFTPEVPVEEEEVVPYNPTALITSLSSLLVVWILSFICCCCIVTCVICCLLLCGSVIGDVACLYFLRFRKFKRKFNKVDVDQMLLEWRNYQDSSEGSGKINREFQEKFKIDYRTLKLIRVIGRGGQNSTVFKCKWKGKKVAYKAYTSLGDQPIEDFQIEASILSSLTHPNILRFFGCVCTTEAKGIRRIGIVMEFCENGDLHNFVMDRLLLEESIPWDERMRFLNEICDGMEYLHERKIIHRDLKCKNVLLKDDYTIRVIDFGLSKTTSVDKSMVHTQRIGTPFYMAPEIIKGHHYDEKVDVYSFAIIMYCMLTLQMNPYKQHKDMDNRVLEQKVGSDPSFRPPIPEDLMIVEREALGEDGKGGGSIAEISWFIELMKMCWDHSPARRPNFTNIKFQMQASTSKKLSRSTRKSLDVALRPMSVFGEDSPYDRVTTYHPTNKSGGISGISDTIVDLPERVGNISLGREDQKEEESKQGQQNSGITTEEIQIREGEEKRGNIEVAIPEDDDDELDEF